MAAQSIQLACEHSCRDGRFEDQFAGFIGTLQVFADDITQRTRSMRDVAQLVAARLPPIHSATEFLLLRSVLVEFSARTLQSAAPHTLSSILRLVMLPPAMAADVCSCCRLGEALVDCLSAAERSPARSRPRSIQTLRSLRAMAIIHSRCSEPTVTAESVASSVGVSRQYLAKLLHLHHGCGFHAALRQARLELARSLLERTLVSIKEIAARSGFSSTSQFDRHFRRRYALTPGEYRRGSLADAPFDPIESTVRISRQNSTKAAG